MDCHLIHFVAPNGCSRILRVTASGEVREGRKVSNCTDLRLFHALRSGDDDRGRTNDGAGRLSVPPSAKLTEKLNKHNISNPQLVLSLPPPTPLLRKHLFLLLFFQVAQAPRGVFGIIPSYKKGACARGGDTISKNIIGNQRAAELTTYGLAVTAGEPLGIGFREAKA